MLINFLVLINKCVLGNIKNKIYNYANNFFSFNK